MRNAQFASSRCGRQSVSIDEARIVRRSRVKAAHVELHLVIALEQRLATPRVKVGQRLGVEEPVAEDLVRPVEYELGLQGRAAAAAALIAAILALPLPLLGACASQCLSR